MADSPLTVPAEAHSSEPNTQPSPDAADPQALARRKTDALLKDLWRRKLPIVEQQLQLLEQASSTVPLSASLRSDATMAAHKLAGSLGMFGYPTGTTLARHLEAHLDTEHPLPQPSFADLLQQLRASLHLQRL